MRRIVVLGSTGSIGTQTLDVVRQHPDKLKIVGLAVNTRAQDMLAQAKEFGVGHLAVGSEDVAAGESALDLATFAKSFGEDGSLGFGMSAVVDLVRLSEADVVVNALVGAAGLRASYETLKAGKVLALANKESLVVGGDLIMPLAAQVDEARRASGIAPAVGPAGALMPIDSEHGAIYQCLLGENEREVAKLWVTASGGPFRTWTKEQIQSATVEQALRHPNWSMGRKITIDSASMVNKALEVIEARHLFGLAPEKIQVVIHPQSIIHSGVEFADGATLVQMGQPDMRVPIAYAMSYPERLDNVAPRLDLTQVGPLTFEQPDFERFPALKLAYQALETGGSAPVLLNGANEIAVERVLAHRLPFWRIAPLLEETLSRVPQTGITCVEDVYAADRAARKAAEEIAARWAI